MKKVFFAILLMVVSILFMQQPAGAVGLKISPLEYRTNLQKGEKKKGYIDISNPTDQKMVVETSSQAFKQIDDQGTIQFFDDEAVSAGILLDLDEFELGPKEAVRMYFILDGGKLPSGDVFAAIFFSTKPATVTTGVGQAVKIGTVLSVVNGTPGARQAAVTDMGLSLFHFSPEVQGTYTIKNTADPASTTGFYPQVRLSTIPFGDSKEVSSKLVFAGRTRTNDFTLKLPPLGIYQVSASYGDSSQKKWIIVAHPVAIFVAVLLVLVLGLVRRITRRQNGFHTTRP